MVLIRRSSDRSAVVWIINGTQIQKKVWSTEEMGQAEASWSVQAPDGGKIRVKPWSLLQNVFPIITIQAFFLDKLIIFFFTTLSIRMTTGFKNPNYRAQILHVPEYLNFQDKAERGPVTVKSSYVMLK